MSKKIMRHKPAHLLVWIVLLAASLSVVTPSAYAEEPEGDATDDGTVLVDPADPSLDPSIEITDSGDLPERTVPFSSDTGDGCQTDIAVTATQSLCFGSFETITGESIGDPQSPAARAGVPIPQECIDAGPNRETLGRYSNCTAAVGPAIISLVRNGKKIPTGTLTLVVINYTFMARDQRVWGNQLEVTATSLTGTAIGATLKMTPECAGDICTDAGGKASNHKLVTGVSMTGKSFWKWEAGAPKTSASGMANWTITISKGTSITAPKVFTTRTVRCDNIVANAGCVIPQATPVVTFFMGEHYDFTAHIQKAQGSGLPGARSSGFPLHRTQDPLRINLNRATACPRVRAGGPVRPSGMSCDEYPFASTFEGAGNGSGGGRTFYDCQVPALPTNVVGPGGYSVCMILEDDNHWGGIELLKVYNTSRVIDGDAFWVELGIPN